jgi:hypothetical protein
MRYYLLGWLLTKRQEISVGKGMGKIEQALYPVGANVDCYSH